LGNTGFSKSKNIPPNLLFKAFKILCIILYEAISIEECDQKPNCSLTRLLFIRLSSLLYIIFSSTLENKAIIEIGLQFAKFSLSLFLNISFTIENFKWDGNSPVDIALSKI
jgi:hypothetical protein